MGITHTEEGTTQSSTRAHVMLPERPDFAGQPYNAGALKERAGRLIRGASHGIFEKEQLIALALLAAASGESLFLLGPPGTAKSMVARRLKAMFREGESFEYLMSRFSTPDEIFGPVSIRRLKDHDRYERNTDGYLPGATVVFLDEIWKAGPAIQNALLTVLNEKIYRNGTETLSLPARGIIAASNELPAPDQGLEALWDRFLIRAVSNCITNEQTFYAMLTVASTEGGAPSIAEADLLTEADLQIWQADAAAVEVTPDTLAAITAIRSRLRQLAEEEGARPADFYISDRRWRKIVKVMRTSALLNGRNRVDASDLLLTVHMLWNSDRTIAPVLAAVADSVYADIADETTRMEEATLGLVEALAARSGTSDPYDFKVVASMYYNIENYLGANCLIPKADYRLLHSSRTSPGVTYVDNTLGSRVLHRLGAMEAYPRPGGASTIDNVEIAKTPGGIVIDGQTYAITGNAATPRAAAPRHEELHSMLCRLADLRDTLEERNRSIASSDNLFLSHHDRQLVNSHLDGLRTRLQSLEIRISGGLMI